MLSKKSRNNLPNKTQKGFTLVELLIAMAILGILATIGLASFRSSQIKSRDGRRKADLSHVQTALEAYFNDHNAYPLSLSWGAEFNDPGYPATIYMKQLPADPVPRKTYCYASDGRTYRIYAKLENLNDTSCLERSCAAARSCGSSTYNYGVSSSDITP